jgi:hypothetical protein
MKLAAFRFLLPALLLVACTSTPPPAGQSAAKPAPQVRVPTAPAAVRAQSAGDQGAPAIAGYRTVVRDGKTLYCRMEKSTGSYLSTERCLTAEQLQRQEEQAHKALDDQRRSPIPGRN